MIDTQQRIITSLTFCGEDVRADESLLAAFDAAQQRRREEIERLLDALDKMALFEESPKRLKLGG
jgi:hypothetical protein